MPVSYGLSLPPPPKKPEDLVSWASGFYSAVYQLFFRLTKFRNELVMEGPDADKPAAAGLRSFYFATDTSKLYYDGGTWVILN
jgi:hypothetical protein